MDNLAGDLHCQACHRHLTARAWLEKLQQEQVARTAKEPSRSRDACDPAPAAGVIVREADDALL